MDTPKEKNIDTSEELNDMNKAEGELSDSVAQDVSGGMTKEEYMRAWGMDMSLYDQEKGNPKIQIRTRR